MPCDAMLRNDIHGICQLTVLVTVVPLEASLFIRDDVISTVGSALNCEPEFRVHMIIFIRKIFKLIAPTYIIY